MPSTAWLRLMGTLPTKPWTKSVRSQLRPPSRERHTRTGGPASRRPRARYSRSPLPSRMTLGSIELSSGVIRLKSTARQAPAVRRHRSRPQPAVRPGFSPRAPTIRSSPSGIGFVMAPPEMIQPGSSSSSPTRCGRAMSSFRPS